MTLFDNHINNPVALFSILGIVLVINVYFAIAAFARADIAPNLSCIDSRRYPKRVLFLQALVLATIIMCLLYL